MMGLSETVREKSLLTRILSPDDGSLMCLYAMRSLGGLDGRIGRGPIILPFCPPTLLICNRIFSGCQPTVNRPPGHALNRTDRHQPVFPNHSREGDENEAVDLGAGRGDFRCRERGRRRAGKEGGQDGQNGKVRENGQEGRQEGPEETQKRQEGRWQEKRRNEEVTRLRTKKGRAIPCLFL